MKNISLLNWNRRLKTKALDIPQNNYYFNTNSISPNHSIFILYLFIHI